MRRLVLPAVLITAVAAAAQTAAPEEPELLRAQRAVLEQIRAEAAALGPMKTSFAQRFLDATARLPILAPRLPTFSNDNDSRWYTYAEAAALGATFELKKHELDVSFYWNTHYGTPVAYARALDLAASRDLAANPAVLDFGCGGLGAPRLLASCGCRVVGVDVDPRLRVLYSEEEDTGLIMNATPGGRTGELSLVIGQWPADAHAADKVKAAVPGGVDLFLSRNTLKNGYIHPAEPVDPRRLVHLGVSDEEFVGAVFAALKPGGLFMIYNICPAPAAAGQPYIPWADGHCPFPREALEAAGFQVLDFDVVDDEPARAMGHALGWDEGEGAMKLKDDLFAWFTVARRPAAGGPK
ncbi:MAG TPA: hypothetical protein VFY71_07085 [Planctomycetota bacterium]|nr:hypothetical protein [Planctomycetota bacterium]